MDFCSELYFNDIIGVTKLSGEVRNIKFLVRNKLAPYINMNPLHSSQEIVTKYDNGDYLFSINIIPNREFFELVIQYQPNLQIITPRDIGIQINDRINEIAAQLPSYEDIKEEDIVNNTPTWDGTLFFEVNTD